MVLIRDLYFSGYKLMAHGMAHNLLVLFHYPGVNGERDWCIGDDRAKTDEQGAGRKG